ncbi:MAG: TonB-dependent receptor plug domain-containing protein, partial [Ginsengibacter sp.]
MKKLSLLFTFLATMLFASAQDNTVTGTVTNSSGKGLEGINVILKGTRKGTVTRSDGSFSIKANSGVLVVSGIGYVQQEVPINGQASLNITLSDSKNELSTVVITALGITKQERKLGYAVTTVGGDQMNKARETNVALSLSGQVAGLNVHGTSGGPGETARILLRGMPSINSGGSPLFVVNGVPINNNNRGQAGEWGGSDNGDGIQNLNPDDIASMTVLKGQAASALYGARASNGVILITTKTGQKGAPLIQYNGNFVWDKPIDLTDFQYVYGQGQNGNKPATISEAQG